MGRHAITDDSGVNLAQINPFRYRGYYYDVETGLYYCKACYYDPTVCRFINADEISEIDPETIGGLNLYVYCGNNPVVRIDPTGCGWFSNLVTAVAVVAVAAVVITSIVLTAGTAVTVGAYGVAAGIGICAASDVGEIYTGTNVVRDYAMGGNQDAYDMLKLGLNMTGIGIVQTGSMYQASTKTTSTTTTSTSSNKQTGNYLLRDANGTVRYTGVGNQTRMATSLRERSQIIPGLTAEFRSAPNRTMALAREAVYINEFGGAQSMNKLSVLLNKINSPGLRHLNEWY